MVAKKIVEKEEENGELEIDLCVCVCVCLLFWNVNLSFLVYEVDAWFKLFEISKCIIVVSACV